MMMTTTTVKTTTKMEVEMIKKNVTATVRNPRSPRH